MESENETPETTTPDSDTTDEQPPETEARKEPPREQKNESGEIKRLVAALQNRLETLETRVDAHDKKFKRAGR